MCEVSFMQYKDSMALAETIMTTDEDPETELFFELLAEQRY